MSFSSFSSDGCRGCLQGAVIAGRGKGFGVASVVRRRLRFRLLGFGLRLGIGLGVGVRIWVGPNLRRDTPLTCVVRVLLPDNAAQVQLHVFHERIVVQA